MHQLHNYVTQQLVEKLKTRRIVVWYDSRREFAPFVGELRGAPQAESTVAPVSVAGIPAYLAEFDGSYLELRAIVEPHVSDDVPNPVLLYVAGRERDRRASLLMELEKAGTTWEPQLKQLARNVLLQKYTVGVVDEMLPFDRKVTYEDLARACAGTDVAEPPSILRSIFHENAGSNALLAAWLVSDGRDAEIESKAAGRELIKMVRSRIGLELSDSAPLSKLRAVTLRYVLADEFRSDLRCTPPSSLDAVPMPPTKDDQSAIRELARTLRTSFSDSYSALADRVEEELGLRNAKIPADAIGVIDTFRFEERVLLSHCGDLIANGNFDDALALVARHEHSFWLGRDVGRKAQWEASRRMAELGMVAVQIRAAVKKTNGDAAAWVGAYTCKDGWHRLDEAQRRLEAWIANLDEEPDERPLGVVRRAYEDSCDAMANGFTQALVKGDWIVAGSLHQTRIFREVVSERPKPVAYFLVDAMRFEMGVELADRLPNTSEVSVRHAIAALPSITQVGMAALQPGASGSFTVVEEEGKLGARVDDVFLPDLASRKKFAAARIPKVVDVALDELLSLQPSRLTRSWRGRWG